MTAGFLRAVAPPDGSPIVRAGQLARRLPRVAKVFKQHIAAFCEVATMLTDRLGVDRSVGTLFECRRALGRQGRAGSGEGRRHTAADADRSRRPGRRLPADARWRRPRGIGGSPSCGARVRSRRGRGPRGRSGRVLRDRCGVGLGRGAGQRTDAAHFPGRRVDRQRPRRHGRLQRSRLAVLIGHSTGVADAGHERGPVLRLRPRRTSRRFDGRRLSTTSGG